MQYKMHYKINSSQVEQRMISIDNSRASNREPSNILNKQGSLILFFLFRNHYHVNKLNQSDWPLASHVFLFSFF